VKELERELQKRYRASASTKGLWQSTLDGFESLQRFYKRSVRKQQPSNPELPLNENMPSTDRPALANTDQESNQTNTSSQETLRLLLCVEEGNSRTPLQQIDLNQISEDRELFLILKARYFARRNWFSIKSVGSLSLNQVCTLSKFLHYILCIKTAAQSELRYF
jgi:hypothetical protein